MKILKPYYIFNLLDNELIINTASSELYIQRVQLIAKENEQDKDFVLETVEQCDAYILDECENLGFDKL